jgi:agmatine deiminase
MPAEWDAWPIPYDQFINPSELGFRMPAEWEPHAATWIAWPHNREDWPGKFAPIPWVYVEIVRLLSRSEPVHIVVRNGAMKRRAAARLRVARVDLERIRFFKAATDRVWLRDSGPTFVVRDRDAPAADVGQREREADDRIGRIALVEWKFNAWAKYKNYRNDRRLPGRVSNWLRLPAWIPRVEQGGKQVRVVMEGGAIDVNGRGSVLTTEECLLGEVQARNPGLGRADVERVLADYLRARHVIWLGRGIVGDDTHGHVDDLARFVDPHTVVTVVEPHTEDPNHGPLQDNLQRLRAARDQDGEPLRVVELPMPRPVWFKRQRLPASYANFYIANSMVLVPTFNDPADRIALDTLAQVFPGREVVGVHCGDLVLGLGTLHCLSQQQPAG